MSDIAVISRLRFDPSIEHVTERPEGATLSEIVALEMAGASDDQLDRLSVVLQSARGSEKIERSLWRVVRPKSGTTVIIRLRVGGGNALRTVLSIAIVAATALFAAWALPVLGPLGTALATAAIAGGSQFLLGQLFKRDDEKPETRYTISGTRNTANPWGVVPQVLGRHRVYPPYWAMPYTSVIGDDQYLHCLFVIGDGGHTLSDPRIGETALGDFSGVDIEFRGGWPDDAPVTLYEETVFEDSLGIELAFEDGFSIRRTARNVDAISVDVFFPSGLFWTDADGEVRETNAAMEVQYRLVGSAFWTFVDTIFVNEAKNESFWRTLRWEVEFGAGQYEVQIKRSVPESEDADTTDTVQWAVLRSIRHEYPINYPRGLALVALRIKASKQLSGTVDQFNLIAEKPIADWDAGTSSWIVRSTSNPASIYRHILQGNATALPRADAEIDLDALAEWHEWCAAKGLTYNRYHDFGSVQREALAQVAAAGRASPTQSGGVWSVVIDRPQTILRAHIGPRNASEFSGEKLYRTLPDAYRVKFLNADDDWKADEKIVNRPGLSGEPQLYEERELPGYTNPALIERGALWMFAQEMQRTEVWYWTQDFEHLVAPRGSLVRMQQPFLDRTASGRVKAVETIKSDPEQLVVVLDEIVTMADGVDYVVRFRLADGTTSLWTVETQPGETSELSLIDGGALPDIGDLALFGTIETESVECIVTAIEPQKDLSARLTLVPHAPEIESIADG